MRRVIYDRLPPSGTRARRRDMSSEASQQSLVPLASFILHAYAGLRPSAAQQRPTTPSLFQRSRRTRRSSHTGQRLVSSVEQCGLTAGLQAYSIWQAAADTVMAAR